MLSQSRYRLRRRDWTFRIAWIPALIWIGSWGQAWSQLQRITEEDFTPASQCGQCHQEIYSQWLQSMHSQSLQDPLYRTVVNKMIEETEGEQKAFCLSCHAPVASVAGKILNLPTPLNWDHFSKIAQEGVTCDFCHTISGDENLGQNISVGAYVYPRSGATSTKYGRHPDAATPAHQTKSSQFLTSAEFCAVCHSFKHPVQKAEIQSTYLDWLAGPYARQGTRCQDCHMPVYSGRTAAEGRPRDRIHAHVFAGGRTAVIRRAATVSVWAVKESRDGGTRLAVTASVTNSGAGHRIPTGIPGIRQMVLTIQALGPDGRTLGEETVTFGQLLLKDDDSYALPWEEFRFLEDNTILPQQSKQGQLDVDLPGQLRGEIKLRASLFMRLISEEMARRLNLPIPEPTLMTESETTVTVP